MTSNASPAMFRGFPKDFWIANGVELLERAAYYGVFIVITLYLSRILGFDDIEAARISGSFSASLYFLATLLGLNNFEKHLKPTISGLQMMLTI